MRQYNRSFLEEVKCTWCEKFQSDCQKNKVIVYCWKPTSSNSFGHSSIYFSNGSRFDYLSIYPAESKDNIFEESPIRFAEISEIDNKEHLMTQVTLFHLEVESMFVWAEQFRKQAITGMLEEVGSSENLGATSNKTQKISFKFSR